MIIKPNLNITTNTGIRNIRKACFELENKIGKDVNPKVSFDVSHIKGKIYISVQDLLTENNKGVFLKLSQGDDNASMLLAKGDENNLRNFISKSYEIVNKKIEQLAAALKKADINEPL